MDKSILLISYAFPPLAAPEAFLAAKTMGALPSFKVDVLHASCETGLLPKDTSLNSYTASRFRSCYPIELSALGQFFLQGSFKKLGKALSRFPDEARYLNANAFKKALALGPSNYSCLMTWSQYHSSHLVGLQIKKAFPKLPWVVHLSDPWVDNPFNPFQWATHPFYKKWEREVFEKADGIFLTSQRTEDLILRRYSSEIRKKVKVIPHPFDESLYPKENENIKKQFLIRYIGKFYGARNPVPLFEAIEKILKQDPKALTDVSFEFIGAGKGFDGEEEGKRRPLNSYVRFLPPCDYLTSLKMMCEADLLLVIDAPYENTVFLPSKLVDYLGAGKSVFGISPEGTSSEVIQELGGECAHPSNPSEIATKLLLAIRKVREGRSVEVAQKRKKYSSEVVGDRTRLAIEAVLR